MTRFNRQNITPQTHWGNVNFPAALKEVWQKINPFGSSRVPGSQRPIAGFVYGHDENSIFDRNFDLEIREVPVRDSQIARELIYFKENCSLAATATRITADRINSSGIDEVGFRVSEFLADGSRVDPEVYRIVQNLIAEVIGGDTPEKAIHQMLYYGDAFAAIGINWTKKQIEKIMFLPTWEMFRIETNDKILLGFEQRHHLSDGSGIKFHPVECVHWRHRQEHLYGLSQYYESRKDWILLTELQQNLRDASHTIGHNPFIHKLPCDYGQTAIEDYRNAYQDRTRKGIITDFFIQNDADIKRVSNFNPSLEGISQAIDHVLYQIARQSQVPPWLLGLPALGVKSDSTYALERNYNEFILKRRAELTRGLRYLCDLELMLNGIKSANYRIVWPRRKLPGNDISYSEEMNTADPSILDLDSVKLTLENLNMRSSLDKKFRDEVERYQDAGQGIRDRRRVVTARALSDLQNQSQQNGKYYV